MKKTLLSMLGLMTAGMVSAQVYITDQQFNPNGVNNEGLVVGSQDQNMPFYLWNPQGGTFTKIGGISAGNGVGGNARFSGDGKFVAAPMFSEAIPVITQWIKSEYSDLSEYTYKDIIPMSDKHYFAVGTSADGKRGAILESVNGGVTWMRSDYVYGAEASGYTPEGGLVSMTDLSPFYFLAGGHNGKLYKTENAYGYELIDIRPEGVTGEVDTYWAMDFINKSIVDKAVNGVVGVEMTDGSYGVWYTADSGETFAVAEGVSGVPAYITSTGDTFFMVTQNGHIQKSADYGKTWTDVFTTDDGSPLYRIRFADESAGVATSDNAVYITENGGADWKKTIIQEEGVNPLADGIKWNDAVWNGDTIVVAGAGGNVYMSTDKGGNFVRQTVDKEYSGDYTTLVCRDRVYNIMAQDGQFYRKSYNESVSGYSAGIYDIENDVWTPVAGTGYMSGDVASAPWRFSGDGKTVVGHVYNLYSLTNNIQAHAAAMTVDSYIDLGSKFADMDKNSSALGVSYDGSVIVGWQDIFGPWYASVWTRNADGSYTQKMMLKDLTKDEDDIDYTNKEECYENLVASARSVSPDGKWIGGDGDELAAIKGPWLWNEEEGYVMPFGDEAVGGSVSAVTNGGEKAVGWQGLGSSAWLYEKGKGVTYLQDYATEVLGCDLGDFYIMSVYDMSPNGRYVTGYGMRGDDVFGYMMDLEAGTTSIESKTVDQTKASVYPNPVADELHIDMPFGSDEVATTLTLVDMQGRVVRRIDTARQSNTMDVSSLTEGIYVLDVNARGTHKAFKIMVRH